MAATRALAGLLLASRGGSALGLKSWAGSEPVCHANGVATYAEPGRPQFHFTPQKNWMNDPNGLVYYKGEYHLFFQHNPSGKQWGNMAWGHAVSANMVHWKQLDHALLPDERGDIFSGSAVVDWQNTSGLQVGPDPPLVAFYANRPRDNTDFSQRLAYSHDKGRSWHKLPGDVVPPIRGAVSARDPKVVWDRKIKQWVMALYLQPKAVDTKKKIGVFALFISKNMKDWKRLEDVELDAPGGECPDFFQMRIGNAKGAAYVFINAEGAYVTGDFNGKAFKALSKADHLEYGDAYAMQTYSDMDRSRKVQLSWMGHGHGTCQPGLAYGEEPFTGQMSLPMDLDLVQVSGSLRVRRKPAEELLMLRRSPALLRQGAAQVTKDAPLKASLARPGGGMEAHVKLRAPKEGQSALRLAMAGQEVAFSVEPGMVNLSTTAGVSQVAELTPCWGTAISQERAMPIHADAKGVVELRVFVDRHSLEIFDLSGGASMALCHPVQCDADGHWLREATLSAPDEPVDIDLFEVFELDSALPPPKPAAPTKI